jgi:hypothetical protein
MKKSLCLFVALFVVLCCTGMAAAKDVIISKEIKNITFKNDKNGNQYARVFVAETHTLNGVTYNKDIALMGFGDTVAKLRPYKKGQMLKVVANEGVYKGNPSYTIIDVVK